MLTLLDRLPAYAALPAGTGPSSAAVRMGRAFDRAWRRPSGEAEGELRYAVALLARRLRVESLPPEKVVVAFKTAIRRFGGVHAMPTLVDEETFTDGLECARTYQRAFAAFVDAYYAVPRG